MLVKAYDEAQLLFIQAIVLFQSIGSKLGVANTLRSQADAVRLKSSIEPDQAKAKRLLVDARSMYQQALPLFLEESDDLGLANTYYSLGEIYFEEKDWGNAQEQYLRAKERYQSAGTPMGLAKTYAQLALVAHALGHSLQRDNYLTQATVAAAASEVPAIVKLVENTALEMSSN